MQAGSRDDALLSPPTDEASGTPQQLAPGIWRIVLPLAFGPPSVNVYLLHGDDQWCMVDCGLGTPASNATLVAALATFGLTFADLDALVLTHAHADHIGPLGKIAAQMRPDAPVVMHALEVDELYRARVSDVAGTQRDLAAMRRRGGLTSEAAQRAARDIHQMARYVRLPPRERITAVQDGATLPVAGQAWRVLETPGHADGHICLVGEHAIFLGDHILPHISPNISLNPGPRYDPVRDYQASLHRVAALPCRDPVALPGHGAVIADLPGRIAELRASVQRRSERVLAALRQQHEPLTALAVTETLFRGRLRRPIDRWLALGEIQAHLEHLCLSDTIGRSEQDGVAYYQA